MNDTGRNEVVTAVKNTKNLEDRQVPQIMVRNPSRTERDRSRT